MTTPAPAKRAAGFLLFRDGPDDREWLILRNALHGTWGFPKGHLDPGEADEEGARRELEEETGLSAITVIPGYALEQSYEVRHPRRGRYRKDVIYFLARLDQGRVQRSEEHDAHRWVDFSEGVQTLQWDSLREALLQAHEHLKTHSGD
jgi:bis(5'-nucleosidyl)-tetraphosphatase